jgi:cephalosporin hydroxylase
MEIKEISTKPLRSSVNGIVTVHEVSALKRIVDIVTDFKPELVISLGTSWGGMEMLFQNCVTSEVPIFSFDIECPRKPDRSKFGNNVSFFLEDIIESYSNDLFSLCSSDKRKLLYCDNGHKILEVLMYGNLLNQGDLLGIHDWGREIHTDWNRIVNPEKRCTREEHERMVSILDWFTNIQTFEQSWFGEVA